ncbi:MAG: hypothetical protein WCJ39_09855 [bacterium]
MEKYYIFIDQLTEILGKLILLMQPALWTQALSVLLKQIIFLILLLSKQQLQAVVEVVVVAHQKIVVQMEIPHQVIMMVNVI